MKTKFFLLCAALLLLSRVLYAQSISADSVNTLNNNNKMLYMAITINNQKLQLAKMQGQLLEKNYKVEKTAAASQKAAGKNEEAATILNNDDQDKNKANTARKTARSADKNAARARNAENKMNDLSEDIEHLQKNLADNIQKLTMMGGQRYLE